MTHASAKTTALGTDDKLFSDVDSIKRADDKLQAHYTTAQVISRIWDEHLRPRRKLVAIAAVAMLFSAATTGATPYLLKIVTDEIFINQNQAMVYTVAFAVLGLTVFKTVSAYVSDVTVQYLGNRFVADMRIAMFEQLVRADLSWLEDVHSGRFISGFLTDSNLLRHTASRAMLTMGENLLKVFVLLANMLWLNWKLTLIMSLCMPVGMVLLGRQRKKMHKSTTKTLQETGDLSALISQTLRSVRVVRAYGQDNKELRKAKGVINRALEFSMRGSRAKALTTPIAELLTGVGFTGVIIYAGTIGMSDGVTFGEFAAFMAAAMLMFQPLRSLATLQTSLQEGVAAASRVFGIIDREKKLVEEPDATALTVGPGEIVLDDLTFAYEHGKPVLNGLSLIVPAGYTVALVGPSGAGKSTILNLVLRFYDPQSGRVLIDGQDIGHVTIKSLRHATALVTQDPVLFDDTLKANIAYGSEGASMADIEAAAKIAQAHDFITAMPNGYETSAREAGNVLSGGERQRIAIARAVLKNAPILLLDEPTSSLDSEAEVKVQDALVQLMKGRTVLMIAHRLSTVQNADLICFLSGGKVVETGRHEELLAKNGAYARLCRLQFLAGHGGINDEHALTF